MKNMILLPKKITPQEAYQKGLDCGKNGANEYNCHFAIFSSPDNTKMWELGKKEGEKQKEAKQ